MSQSSEPKSLELPDWDLIYRQGRPPWETGLPAGELVRIVEKGVIPFGTTLELGCGTGADAVYLARRGFEVTAVDFAPTALERARNRAQMEGVPIRFVLDDVFEFAPTAGQFDFVYDGGFYHFVRQVDLARFLDMLWRVTHPGSFYLALIGGTAEDVDGWPPGVTEHEIRFELARLFDFVRLRPCRIDSPDKPKGYRGWSCLMKRPEGFQKVSPK